MQLSPQVRARLSDRIGAIGTRLMSKGAARVPARAYVIDEWRKALSGAQPTGETVRALDANPRAIRQSFVQATGPSLIRSQRRSLHQLHHQIFGPYIVQRADVRMIQRCDAARLALEGSLNCSSDTLIASSRFKRVSSVAPLNLYLPPNAMSARPPLPEGICTALWRHCAEVHAAVSGLIVYHC